MGDFIRAKRDSARPEDLGITSYQRRRAPGLRRSELASRSGISVEYLTRIEQGRDRNPSIAVVNALADGLSLASAERVHLRYLAKISGGECLLGAQLPERPVREVRPTVDRTLRLLEPGVAMVTNRLGDVLAHTSGFDLVMRWTGLLERDEPNLTSYVFTDARAKSAFSEWGQVADEQAFNLCLGPSAVSSEWFSAGLAPLAGAEFTRRLGRYVPPPSRPLAMNHPEVGPMRWDRETLELPDVDAQQIVVFLPVNERTANAVERLRRPAGRILHAV